MKRKKPVLASKFLIGVAKTFYGKKYFTKKVNLIADGTLASLKPPFVVVANHCGFVDVGGLVMMLGNNCGSFVISVTQMAQWPSLIKHMGVLPKKQFTVDTSLIKDIKYVLSKGRPVIIYPEAKLSVVGTPNVIKPAVAKLIKLLKVPLVTVKFNGSYLHKPRWATNKRFCPVTTEVKVAVSQDEVGTLSVDEIHNRIVTNLAFDDYAYQLENKIKIDVPDLVEGLQGILYKCPQCGNEFHMSAKGNTLTCDCCGATVTQNEYGQLVGGKFSKITEWYAYQTECVRNQLMDGTYSYSHSFLAEKLVGKKYRQVGQVTLTHGDDGITVTQQNGQELLHYPRDAFYTLSFNNDYVYLPSPDAVYRFARLDEMGCTTKLNIAIEQQSILDEEHSHE